MSDGVSTASSVRDADGAVDRGLNWLLLTGNRLLVAIGLTVVAILVVYGLIQADVITVGPDSVAETAFGSGLISGTLTLVTVALSINQLILSRVFGSPDGLRDKLDGTRELRTRVRDHAGESATPNDPAEFLSLIAETLSDHADRFETTAGGSVDGEPSVRSYAEGIRSYGESIDEKIENGTNIVDVLVVIIGTEYARNLTATEYIGQELEESLSEEASEELEAIDDLLESIAITRQFFKTLSLQQDFARLSRVVAYTGFVALLTSIVLTLLYRPEGMMIDPAYAPLVVSVGLGIILTPLTIFIAYILRAATIGRRTVSVGPFVPPEDREEDS
ncbi:hypothetical protein [Natrononativus amylolyticus]|uniref:hypothetical protein n=1 Tax=Natrononativus amylolyticus TaxID=2963434 RepID=UPI0020CC006D|nr:hypothetical protein [Natrononativus amylolyticus]